MKKIRNLLTACMIFTGTLSAVEIKSLESQQTIQSEVMTINSYVCDEKSTKIFLNNGMQWVYKDTDAFAQPKGWEAGDRVQIVYIHFKGYYLQNISYPGQIPVELINASSNEIVARTICSIDKNAKNNTHQLTLDDGTSWHVGSWSSGWMKKWKSGDKVIVTPHKFLFGDAEHLIINLNRKLYINDCCSNVRAQILNTSFVTPADNNVREGKTWKTRIASVSQDSDYLTLILDNQLTLKTHEMPEEQWTTGDEVNLYINHKKITVITNMTRDESIDADIVNKNSGQLLTSTIQQIKNKGKKVILDDGSIWLNRDEKKSWLPGERIVVSTLEDMTYDTCTHCLINLDKYDSMHSTLVR